MSIGIYLNKIRNVLHPGVVETISNKCIVDIACGSDSSAAISDHGELFTWGCGFQGCLGHGNGETYKLPKKVSHIMYSDDVAIHWSNPIFITLIMSM